MICREGGGVEHGMGAALGEAHESALSTALTFLPPVNRMRTGREQRRSQFLAVPEFR